MKNTTWFVKHLSATQIDKIGSMPGLFAFRRHLDSFSQYLLAERNFSEKTKVNYQSDLLQFLNYLADKGLDLDPASLSPEHVRAYLAHCKETLGHGPAIRARRV